MHPLQVQIRLDEFISTHEYVHIKQWVTYPTEGHTGCIEWYFIPKSSAKISVIAVTKLLEKMTCVYMILLRMKSYKRTVLYFVVGLEKL